MPRPNAPCSTCGQMHRVPWMLRLAIGPATDDMPMRKVKGVLPKSRSLDFARDDVLERSEFLRKLSCRACRGISPTACSRFGQHALKTCPRVTRLSCSLRFLLARVVCPGCMQGDIHARIILVGDQMVVFSGFAHNDVAGCHDVRRSVDFHPRFALQENENLVVIRVDMASLPIARRTGTADVVRPMAGVLKGQPSVRQIFTRYYIPQHVPAALTLQIRQTKPFHDIHPVRHACRSPAHETVPLSSSTFRCWPCLNNSRKA